MTEREFLVSDELVEARRVLLDALDALGRQRDAIVVVGAQAIYLRAGPTPWAVADHTTDGDLVLNPELLVDSPLLEDVMSDAGFELIMLQNAPEPGIWKVDALINGRTVEIPVDLIVPEGVAPPGGRRGVRLGVHGKRAARKIPGLEGALVDNDPIEIGAFDPNDARKVTVNVAGIAALFVAKAHKLKDRLASNRENRINDKDASDVVRMMVSSSPVEISSKLTQLKSDPVSGNVTASALEALSEMFGARNGAGIEMAARALRLNMPEQRVRAICLGYMETIEDSLK